jgi:hypothetical protein
MYMKMWFYTYFCKTSAETLKLSGADVKKWFKKKQTIISIGPVDFAPCTNTYSSK